MRRFWTPDEIDALRQLYLRVPAREIAALLERPLYSVHQAADRHGLSRRGRRWADREKARLRELHAKGWSDTQIAKDLGSDRHVVGAWRARLGLPSVLWSEHQRRRTAANTREQIRKAGLRSMADLRIKAHRDLAIRSGWPEDLLLRETQILNALWEHGPQTRYQLCEAIGMPWKGSRQSMHSNRPDGSYLAHLLKRGLVVTVGKRVVRTGRRGGNLTLYSLPLGIQRNLA